MLGDRHPSYDELAGLVQRQADQIAQLEEIVARQADRIAELEHLLLADSSNSSKPPSLDAPWAKPAPKYSSRGQSDRKPGKQPHKSGPSRSLTNDPNHTVRLEPGNCRACGLSLVRPL